MVRPSMAGPRSRVGYTGLVLLITIRKAIWLLGVLPACLSTMARAAAAPSASDAQAAQLGAILDYVVADYDTAVGERGILDAEELKEQQGFLAEALSLAAELPSRGARGDRKAPRAGPRRCQQGSAAFGGRAGRPPGSRTAAQSPRRPAVAPVSALARARPVALRGRLRGLPRRRWLRPLRHCLPAVDAPTRCSRSQAGRSALALQGLQRHYLRRSRDGHAVVPGELGRCRAVGSRRSTHWRLPIPVRAPGRRFRRLRWHTSRLRPTMSCARSFVGWGSPPTTSSST